MNAMANTTFSKPIKNKYKAIGCLGTIVYLSGAVMAFRGVANDNGALAAVGLVLFGIGAVAVIAARIGNWWND